MGKYDSIHIEEDFWNDFIVEAFEHIDEIESNAMSLEQNPENTDIIHTMFRAFHTIKGLSGFVEHILIQEIAHKTETLMDFCRKGELAVSTQIVDAILKSSDYIKQLCNDVNAYKEDALVTKIEELLIVLEALAIVEKESEAKISDEEAKVQKTSEEHFDIIPESAQKEESLEIQPKVDDTVAEQTQQLENGAQEIALGTDEGLKAFAMEELEAQQHQEEDKEDANLNNEPNIEKTEQALTQESTITEEKVETKTEEKKEEDQVDPNLRAFQNDIIQKLKGNDTQKKAEAKETQVQKTSSVNEEYMKVANYKIDHLVDMIGELIINQSLIEQYVVAKYTNDKELTTNMSGFLRITRELQNLSMSLRMVSVKSTFQKINRIARDTIQELGKNVEFIISGENTEVDRVVTDKLLDPLVHLIKNAISHGVEENVQDRIDKGKNPRAKVELCAYSKRGKIFIEVKDDGRGINTEVVYQKALEKGLIDPNRTYSDAEIKEFILLPGFSTAKVVDNISGRGVGMDVVKTQILKIGGKVEIQSELGQGSIFTLEVPVNNSIMNGTIIEMNKQHFVVPTINVKEFLQPNSEQWIYTKKQRTMIRVRESIIPIVPMSVFFKDEYHEKEENIPLVMIVELGEELRAVPITNVINRQEVVVKPVGEEFSHLKYISGMSILGTGKVSLILDIDYLFRKEIKE